MLRWLFFPSQSLWIEENCLLIFGFSKGFAVCWILASAFFWIVDYNQNQMQYLKCGHILKHTKILVVECVDTWNWESSLLMMKQVTDPKGNLNLSLQKYQHTLLMFKSLKSFNTTLLIYLINLLKELLAIFMSYLEPSQDIIGMHWRMRSLRSWEVMAKFSRKTLKKGQNNKF